MTNIQNLRNQLERKKGERDQLQQTIDELKQKIQKDKRMAIRHEKEAGGKEEQEIRTSRRAEKYPKAAGGGIQSKMP